MRITINHHEDSDPASFLLAENVESDLSIRQISVEDLKRILEPDFWEISEFYDVLASYTTSYSERVFGYCIPSSKETGALIGFRSEKELNIIKKLGLYAIYCNRYGACIDRPQGSPTDPIYSLKTKEILVRVLHTLGKKYNLILEDIWKSPNGVLVNLSDEQAIRNYFDKNLEGSASNPPGEVTDPA